MIHFYIINAVTKNHSSVLNWVYIAEFYFINSIQRMIFIKNKFLNSDFLSREIGGKKEAK